MIMGKIISRNKYEYYEYFTAGMISAGMAFFMLGSADDKGKIKFLYFLKFLIFYNKISIL